MYDLDFEILQSLEHPLARMVLAGEKFGDKLGDLRGKNAWIACWLLTRSLDDAEKAWADGKIAELSRKEFGRKQLGEITDLMKAVFAQFGGFFSTVSGFESVEDAKEGSQPAQKKSE